MALVLVVDDSEEDLILLKEFLYSLGHRCRLATSGHLALDLLSVETFDLIISDFQMPGGDGRWLLQELERMIDAPKWIVVASDVRGQKPMFWQNLQHEIDHLIP